MQVDQILSRLEQIKQTGNGEWMASCPAHDDSTPSLSVKQAGEHILINCFGGCKADEVCAAIGVELKDLFVEETLTSEPRIVGKGMSLKLFHQKTQIPMTTLGKAGLTEEKHKGKTCVRIPYYDYAGNEIYAKIRLPGKPKYTFETPLKELGKNQVPYGLQFLDSFRTNKHKVVLVEGETDTLTLWSHGVPAIGIPGSTALATMTAGMFGEGFTDIYVVQENDPAGKKFAVDVPVRLREIGYKGAIHIVTLPPDVKDINDLYRQNGERFRGIFWDLIRRSRSTADKIADYLEDWSDIEEQEIQFLWPTYVPKGFVTLLAGQGGKGKSFITCNLSASVTRGRPMMPWDDTKLKRGKVLFCGTEDDPRYVGGVKTRLSQAGADLGLIRSLDLTRYMNEQGEMFSLNEDGVQFLQMVLDQWPAQLVIVDPVIRFMGSDAASINNNTQVRKVMDNLAHLAKIRGISILCVAHFRKGGGNVAVESIMGAVDFVNAARSVLLVYPNPRARPTEEEKAERSFFGAVSHDKVNLFPRSPTQSYRIWQRSDGSPGFEWTGELDLGPEDLAQKCGRSPQEFKRLQDLRKAIVGYLDVEGETPIKKLRSDIQAEYGAPMNLFYDALLELEEENVLERHITPALGDQPREVTIERIKHEGELEEVRF